jgi:hypothetical protein
LTCARNVLAVMNTAANAPARRTQELHIFAFNNIRNARPWILHDVFGGTVPDPLHLLRERFGLTRAVEFQIDHHVVWVILQAKDLIAANARSFAIRGVTIERLLPFVKIRNRVLNSYNGHAISS